MNKKKVSLFAVISIGLLIAAAAAVVLQNSGIMPKATIGIAYGAGTPDALGNCISSLQFTQNTTGSWTNVATLTSSSYVLNYNLTIPANQHTRIGIYVYLNISLAPDASTALARVRVYVTISGVVTSASMIPVSATSVLLVWVCLLMYPSTGIPATSTWIPATDTTYTITVQYQAYY